METLAMEPLVLRVTNFLDADECDRLVELAAPRLKASLTMGDTEATERSSSSVFLAAGSGPGGPRETELTPSAFLLTVNRTRDRDLPAGEVPPRDSRGAARMSRLRRRGQGLRRPDSS